MIRFSVSLVSGYLHVLVLLSGVVITLPVIYLLYTRGGDSGVINYHSPRYISAIHGVLVASFCLRRHVGGIQCCSRVTP